jgi:hypothetical protein
MKFIAYTNDKNYTYFTSKSKGINNNNYLNLISRRFQENTDDVIIPFSYSLEPHEDYGTIPLSFPGDFIPKIYINRWIMGIVIPNQSKFKGVSRCPPWLGYIHDYYWSDDGYIFSDLYDICNITTLKKFNIQITLGYINVLCAFDKTDILDLLIHNHNLKNYLKNLNINQQVNLRWNSELPMDIASAYGSVNVLQWWVDNNMPLSYSYKALHNASVNGHVNVLDWWKNSKLRLDYNEDVLKVISRQTNSDIIDNVIEWWFKSGLKISYSSGSELIQLASKNGHVKLLNHYKKIGLIGQGFLGMLDSENVSVLEWWMYNYKKHISDGSGSNQENKSKNIFIVYTEDVIDNASKNGNIDILNWWVNSKLQLKYSHKALDNASGNGHVNVLNWWVNSKLKLKYTYRALDIASIRGHINVLEWWKHSGRKLKYSDTAINYASIKGHVDVLEWWKNSGLKLKYCDMALKCCYNVKVLEWWVNSNLPLKYSKKFMKDVDYPYYIITWWKNSGLLEC